MKVSLFAEDMILYIENPQEITKSIRTYNQVNLSYSLQDKD